MLIVIGDSVVDIRIQSGIGEHNVGDNLVLSAVVDVQRLDGSRESGAVIAFSEDIFAELVLVVFSEKTRGEKVQLELRRDLEAAQLGAQQISGHAVLSGSLWNSWPRGLVQLADDLSVGVDALGSGKVTVFHPTQQRIQRAVDHSSHVMAEVAQTGQTDNDQRKYLLFSSDMS